jgi:hypothetical protein
MSDEARRQVEQYAAEKRERARAGVTPYYLQNATVEGVRPGWPIYSATRSYTDADPGIDRWPVGGMVVEVVPAATDYETGELTPARYRCLDRYHRYPGRHPWQWLTADEVALPLEGVKRTEATACGYWLLRQVPPNRRVFHPADVDWLHDAWILAQAAAVL